MGKASLVIALLKEATVGSVMAMRWLDPPLDEYLNETNIRELEDFFADNANETAGILKIPSEFKGPLVIEAIFKVKHPDDYEFEFEFVEAKTLWPVSTEK